MRIPVFVSCPTTLRPDQIQVRSHIDSLLQELGLEARALGKGDYPVDLPLREILVVAKKCAGGIILGFQQASCHDLLEKEATPKEKRVAGKSYFPTPWNQIEAGILFSLRLPVLIFREHGVSGGVFDYGVTDVFVHAMPSPEIADDSLGSLREVFLKWRDRVGAKYYE